MIFSKKCVPLFLREKPCLFHTSKRHDKCKKKSSLETLIAAKLVKQIKATKCNDEHNDIGIAPCLLKAPRAAEIAPRILIFGNRQRCALNFTLRPIYYSTYGVEDWMGTESRAGLPRREKIRSFFWDSNQISDVRTSLWSSRHED